MMVRQMKSGKDAQNLDIDIFKGFSGELPLIWNSKNKKMVLIHDLIFVRFPQYYSFFDRKIYLWKFKKAAQQADVIIAISEQTKRDIIEFLKVPEERVRGGGGGGGGGGGEKKSEEFLNSIKIKFNLPEKFILNVGTIEERKNLLNIVKALKDTEIPLVVVGKKTKYFKKIDKEIRKNGVEVHFLEGVTMDELSGLYQLAEIFVYPSFFEGFGIPIIEALFSKTPVITSNLSCLPEAGGPDSLYINPKNVDDIKAKIQFLWENEPEQKRRAEKGLEFVQKFSDVKIAEDLMKVYSKVLEK